MNRLDIYVVLFMGMLLVSCSTSKQSVDCTPEREKHVNKMQKIPMPADTTKTNRAKFD